MDGAPEAPVTRYSFKQKTCLLNAHRVLVVYSRILSCLSLVVIFSVIAITGAAFWTNHWLHSPLPIKAGKIITIAAGDTLSKVTYDLYNKGLLSYPRIFIAYAKISDKTRLEVGEFQIKAGISPDQLLKHPTGLQVL